MEKIEIVRLLIERINHLEDILVTSLLGFLITATLAVFAAVYQNKQVKQGDATRVAPIQVILAVNFLYLILSGYFYSMLTHFYGAAIPLIILSRQMGLEPLLSNLWNIFELAPLPLLDEMSRNRLYLFAVPTLPLFVSCGVVSGVWALLKSEITSRMSRYLVLVVSYVIHLIYFYLLISVPFWNFIKTLNLL